MLSGIAHDPIQRDIFTPIFFGASIYIPDGRSLSPPPSAPPQATPVRPHLCDSTIHAAEDIHNPGQLAKWVAANEVNILHLTPAMGQLLTANATTMMPSIRCVLLVGDILTKRDVKRLQRLGRNATVVNMFGTTETQRAVSYLVGRGQGGGLICCGVYAARTASHFFFPSNSALQKIPNDNSIDIMKEVLPAGIGMKDVQLLGMSDRTIDQASHRRCSPALPPAQC